MKFFVVVSSIAGMVDVLDLVAFLVEFYNVEEQASMDFFATMSKDEQFRQCKLANCISKLLQG